MKGVNSVGSVGSQLVSRFQVVREFRVVMWRVVWALRAYGALSINAQPVVVTDRAFSGLRWLITRRKMHRITHHCRVGLAVWYRNAGQQKILS